MSCQPNTNRLLVYERLQSARWIAPMINVISRKKKTGKGKERKGIVCESLSTLSVEFDKAPNTPKVEEN